MVGGARKAPVIQTYPTLLHAPCKATGRHQAHILPGLPTDYSVTELPKGYFPVRDQRGQWPSLWRRASRGRALADAFLIPSHGRTRITRTRCRSLDGSMPHRRTFFSTACHPQRPMSQKNAVCI